MFALVVFVQDKIDRAGGEPLRKQKEKVASLRVSTACHADVAAAFDNHCCPVEPSCSLRQCKPDALCSNKECTHVVGVVCGLLGLEVQ